MRFGHRSIQQGSSAALPRWSAIAAAWILALSPPAWAGGCNLQDAQARFKAAEQKIAQERNVPERVAALRALPPGDPKLQALASTRLIHATNSSTLALMDESAPVLQPAGELISQGKPIFAGELGPGITSPNGVNRRFVSVADLGDVGNTERSTAVSHVVNGYAHPAIAPVTWEQETRRLTRDLEQIQKYLAEPPPQVAAGRMLDLQIRLANLKVLGAARYEAEIKPLVSDAKLAELAQTAKSADVDASFALRQVKKVRDMPSPIQLKEADRRLTQEPFPIVFGSSEAPPTGSVNVRSDIRGEVGVPLMRIGEGGYDRIFVDPSHRAEILAWCHSRGLDAQIASGKLQILDIGDLVAYQRTLQP